MAFTDLAAAAAANLQAGSPARLTMGEDQPAFAWVEGFVGLSTVVPAATCTGLTFTAQRVTESGTPVIEVGAGAPKPSAVTISGSPITLTKYAGKATCTLEAQLSSSTLLTAMSEALIHQAMAAFETDLIADVIADTDVIAVDAAPGIAGILEGQAAVWANGGSPNTVVLAPADYAVIASTGTPGLVTYAQDLSEAVITLLGSQVVVSGALAAGTAIVCDRNAILAVQNASSPGLLFDPYSSSGNNQLNIVADLLASGYVARPGSVAIVKDLT